LIRAKGLIAIPNTLKRGIMVEKAEESRPFFLPKDITNRMNLGKRRQTRMPKRRRRMLKNKVLFRRGRESLFLASDSETLGSMAIIKAKGGNRKAFPTMAAIE
jgi:hypothetical protein